MFLKTLFFFVHIYEIEEVEKTIYTLILQLKEPKNKIDFFLNLYCSYWIFRF